MGCLSGTSRPLSFILLSHSDNRSESTTKFYNSSKADAEGNMLTPTLCVLRSDWTASFWMPTDLVKLPVHSEAPAPGWPLSLFFYFFISGWAGWGWGLSALAIQVHTLCVCVCWGGGWGVVFVCMRAGNCECEGICVSDMFVFLCVSVSLCFVWLSMSSNVLLCYWLCFFKLFFTYPEVPYLNGQSGVQLFDNALQLGHHTTGCGLCLTEILVIQLPCQALHLKCKSQLKLHTQRKANTHTHTHTQKEDLKQWFTQHA